MRTITMLAAATMLGLGAAQVAQPAHTVDTNATAAAARVLADAEGSGADVRSTQRLDQYAEAEGSGADVQSLRRPAQYADAEGAGADARANQHLA